MCSLKINVESNSGIHGPLGEISLDPSLGSSPVRGFETFASVLAELIKITHSDGSSASMITSVFDIISDAASRFQFLVINSSLEPIGSPFGSGQSESKLEATI